MIKISGNIIPAESLLSGYPKDGIESNIINILSKSANEYEYSSLDYLNFEIALRMSIIQSAKELYKSRMAFKVFRDAFCNSDYWEITDEGGFLLRDDVKASDAINDIFKNGRKYGTECATAMVIIYYKAVLNVFPEDLYNDTFSNIYLMDWQHADRKLGINYYDNVTDFLPGDCRYFKNPDVDPIHPEWQGENTIDLGDGTYYGHGIGIRTSEKIIDILNSLRKEGATESAYLLNSATRPNFLKLADIKEKGQH